MSSGTHLLVFPYPTSGHILPILDLVQSLLRRGGFTITLLVTPPNLALLQPLLSLFPTSFTSLLLSSTDDLLKPLPAPKLRATARILALRCLCDPIRHWFRSHPSPPVAILSDIFLAWTHQLAIDLGIKRIAFSPSGSFAFSVCNFLWRRPPTEEDNNETLIRFDQIPGCAVQEWRKLSNLYRDYAPGDPDWELFRDSWPDNNKSWGIVVNSFAELERVYIDHVKTESAHPSRVWAVGPLLLSHQEEGLKFDRGGASTRPVEEVMSWLDQRQDGSVVYICFGSRSVLNRKQMEVLSTGLDFSGVSFVWCVRSDGGGGLSVPDELGELPESYGDVVAGRGLVVRGWAPQVQILNHKAVGVFLTHCGWNSVLEGLSAGVMMLAWPMGADQFTNADLVVEEKGVGVRVGESTWRIPEACELAAVLVESVDGFKPQKARALELKVAAMAAVRGGSSSNDMSELAKQLRGLSSTW